MDWTAVCQSKRAASAPDTGILAEDLLGLFEVRTEARDVLGELAAARGIEPLLDEVETFSVELEADRRARLEVERDRVPERPQRELDLVATREGLGDGRRRLGEADRIAELLLDVDRL